MCITIQHSQRFQCSFWPHGLLSILPANLDCHHEFDLECPSRRHQRSGVSYGQFMAFPEAFSVCLAPRSLITAPVITIWPISTSCPMAQCIGRNLIVSKPGPKEPLIYTESRFISSSSLVLVANVGWITATIIHIILTITYCFRSVAYVNIGWTLILLKIWSRKYYSKHKADLLSKNVAQGGGGGKNIN